MPQKKKRKDKTKKREAKRKSTIKPKNKKIKNQQTGRTQIGGKNQDIYNDFNVNLKLLLSFKSSIFDALTLQYTEFDPLSSIDLKIQAVADLIKSATKYQTTSYFTYLKLAHKYYLKALQILYSPETVNNPKIQTLLSNVLHNMAVIYYEYYLYKQHQVIFEYILLALQCCNFSLKYNKSNKKLSMLKQSIMYHLGLSSNIQNDNSYFWNNKLVIGFIRNMNPNNMLSLDDICILCLKYYSSKLNLKSAKTKLKKWKQTIATFIKKNNENRSRGAKIALLALRKPLFASVSFKHMVSICDLMNNNEWNEFDYLNFVSCQNAWRWQRLQIHNSDKTAQFACTIGYVLAIINNQSVKQVCNFINGWSGARFDSVEVHHKIEFNYFLNIFSVGFVDDLFVGKFLSECKGNGIFHCRGGEHYYHHGGNRLFIEQFEKKYLNHKQITELNQCHLKFIDARWSDQQKIKKKIPKHKIFSSNGKLKELQMEHVFRRDIDDDEEWDGWESEQDEDKDREYEKYRINKKNKYCELEINDFINIYGVAYSRNKMAVLNEMQTAKWTDQYNQGVTYIHHFAMNGCFKTVEFLIEHGVDVNILDRFPDIWARKQPIFEYLSTPLDMCWNVLNYSTTPISIQKRKRIEKTIKILKQYGGKTRKRAYTEEQYNLFCTVSFVKKR